MSYFLEKAFLCYYYNLVIKYKVTIKSIITINKTQSFMDLY